MFSIFRKMICLVSFVLMRLGGVDGCWPRPPLEHADKLGHRDNPHCRMNPNRHAPRADYRQ